jgi:hypothetical protein
MISLCEDEMWGGAISMYFWTNKSWSTTYNIWVLLISIWISFNLVMELHQNHPTFHHVNSPYDACSECRKSAFWIPKHLAHCRRSAKYSNSTFLARVILYEHLQCL